MSDFLSITKQDNHSDRPNTSNLGRIGEEIAAKHLQTNGYRLVVSNFRAPIGRNRKGVAVTGEIDLIALDNDVLCFVEVKTRHSDKFASPLASVDLRKQRQITRAARIYRKIFRVEDMTFRYDVISVLIKSGKMPDVQLFKGFWRESKFRKNIWTGEF